jgi:hypothetical protein
VERPLDEVLDREPPKWKNDESEERERRGKITNPKKVILPSPSIFSNSGGWWAGRPTAGRHCNILRFGVNSKCGISKT